ncbi:hypothetical protein LRB11_16540 [Ectothiorhodospira haloalkaliphila]|uniref:hypothetical protein n=1 Tax=Ectothiorhodospira haloalkaliphila TaxID=421628 RepID=UPI001EE8AE15|nr:hypothetical protein [Ectothiorhodospira haloalkaliphila]MCG5526513.1 hypothetical protein [Ectothiorhodospira haloalkaliphila]
MEDRNDDSQFMGHPDVQLYLRELLPAIIEESDRGAVLLAASQIDEQLKQLFETILPDETSNRRKKEIFNLTGPFGSFSAKLDVAYVCRLLPATLIKAIHRFRMLRNDVAHEALRFRLKDHKAQIYEIFSLVGPGVDLGVNRMALELMMESILGHLTSIESPTEEGKPMFDSRQAVLDYLSENPGSLKNAEDHQQRWELGVGGGIICGLIVYHRDRLSAAIGPDDTLVSVFRRMEKSNESKPRPR